MHKYLNLDVSWHALPSRIVLTVRPPAVQEWCLGLSLLQEGLIAKLVVADREARHKMSVLLLPDATAADLAEVSVDGMHCQVALSPTQLGYVRGFFMAYYRDGFATVDHLDLYARVVANGERSEDGYLIVRVTEVGSGQ